MSGSWASWLTPLLQAGTSLYGAYTANQSGKNQANAANQAAQLQANAANQAAQLQANTTNAQTNLLAQMYNQNRADQEPYRTAGNNALQAYTQNLTGDFQNTPGYQFTQNEAMRGVMANAASRGLVNSGATLRALQDRSANIASQTYGDYMNRLGTVMGMGQNAAAQTGNAAQNYGTTTAGVLGTGAANTNNLLTQSAAQQGNYLTGAAGVQASGANQAANALMGGANNLLTWWNSGK